jgi:hypothetical protein
LKISYEGSSAIAFDIERVRLIQENYAKLQAFYQNFDPIDQWALLSNITEKTAMEMCNDATYLEKRHKFSVEPKASTHDSPILLGLGNDVLQHRYANANANTRAHVQLLHHALM